MAVKRYMGDHFFGLQADTKPTDVDNGATFDEYDTGTLYHKINEVWTAFTFSAGSTGDWTFGTGTITGPAAGSLITVGALTLGTSAANTDVIIDPHGTGGLQLKKPSSGAFKIKTDETGGSGTGLITIFPEDGTITYGAGISIYAYTHAAKPGETWIGYGSTGKISFGLGSDATLGTARATINGTVLDVALTTNSTSSTVGAFIVGNAVAATSVACGGGNLNVGAGLAVKGSMTIGGSTTTAGAVTTGLRLIKAVTAITDATPKDIITVTIPNAAHSASITVKVIGSLGAGGAIGANEANASAIYDFTLSRTAGVACVVGASTAYGGASSSVAGATTCTTTLAATAMTGAVSAQQTFTIQVTVTKGGGSSANHTALIMAEVMNSNATGVTIA